MVPMCVSTCIARANYFGDPDDKESLIYKVIKANKISVLRSVKSNGAAKLTFAQLKDLTSEEIATKTGYPGKTPVFAETSLTKPRVYYILP
jgi:Fe-S-cluster-containing dehydrogenase component